MSPPPNSGSPTPPIAIAGGAAAATGRLTAPVVLLDDAFLARLGRRLRRRPARPRRAGRGQPRLVAAGHGLGHRGPGRPGGRRRGPAHRPPTRWPTVLRLCNERPRPGHPGRRALQRGGRHRARSTAACVLDLTGLVGHRATSTPTSGHRRGAGRHLRRPVRGGAPGDPPADRRPLAAVDGAVHRRRLAGLPRAPASSRTATARSRTSSSASRWCWPTAPSSAPAASPARRSGPTSPSCSSAPRAPWASSPGPGSRPGPRPTTPPGRPGASPRFSAGARRHAPHHPARRPVAVLRLYDGIESQPELRRRAHGQRAARLRRGRRRRWSTPACPWWPRSAPTPTALDDALVEQWFGHRNNVDALEALISKGYVVDTMEISGAAGRSSTPSTTPPPRPSPPCPAPWPSRPTSRTRTSPAPASTSPSPPRWSPPSARRTTGRVGRRHPGRARQRRLAQPPPRRRPQPGPVRARGARRRARRARRGEGRARPARHLQPRQARPARPVRRPGPLARPRDAIDRPRSVARGRRRAGASLLAVPAALANGVLADQDDQARARLVAPRPCWSWSLGFFVAGWLGRARGARRRRATHGAARRPRRVRARRGHRRPRPARPGRRPVGVRPIVLVGLLAAGAGTVGAQPRRPPRRRPPGPGGRP